MGALDYFESHHIINFEEEIAQIVRGPARCQGQTAGRLGLGENQLAGLYRETNRSGADILCCDELMMTS